MKRALYIIVLLLTWSLGVEAQNPGRNDGMTLDDKGGKTDKKPKSEDTPKALPDTVFTIPDYNADLPSGSDILKQDVSVKPVKKFHSTHMIGVRYGVNLASAKFSPDVLPGSIICPNNFGLVYTYYNDLWDMMDNFGTQIIARLDREGFTAEYVPDMKYTVAELDLMANLRFNIKAFRIFANVGPYAGYRIDNDRDGEQKWYYYDNRFDYGLMFGGGVGLMIGPFEFQLETNYKWGLSSYYHTYYYSDEYWLFAYPRVFLFSGTLYFKF